LCVGTINQNEKEEEKQRDDSEILNEISHLMQEAHLKRQDDLNEAEDEKDEETDEDTPINDYTLWRNNKWLDRPPICKILSGLLCVLFLYEDGSYELGVSFLADPQKGFCCIQNNPQLPLLPLLSVLCEENKYSHSFQLGPDWLILSINNLKWKCDLHTHGLELHALHQQTKH
jgi:hypothetical protein